jgi:hypothetical protein
MTFNVFICHSQAESSIGAKHLIIAPLSSFMLTKVSSEGDTNISPRLAAITHVLVATGLVIDPQLVAFSSVEAGRCTRIACITNFIPASTIESTPSIIAVNTVLSVQIKLLQPRNIRAQFR